MRVAICALALTLLGALGSGKQHHFIMDLRGDGFSLGGVNRSTGTRWTLPQTDDAFLAIDATALHAMGIDVFRDRTRLDGIVLLSTSLRIVADGQSHESDRTFALLSALDANRDGKLDNRDTTWPCLRAFVDGDVDGKIGPTELRDLSEAAIASISTKSSAEPRSDAYGNILVDGWMNATDGRTRKTADVLLATAPDRERLATR